MKILFISTLYAPHIGGGAEIVLQSLVEGFHDRGHDVTVLTTGPNTGLNEEFIKGVRVVRSGLTNVYWHGTQKRPAAWKRFLWHARDSYNPAMGNIIEQFIRQEQPDVVNTHSLVGWSCATWAAIQRTETPVVQTLHDVYNFCPKATMFHNGHACATQCLQCKLFRLPHPSLSNRVNAVVGVSQFILNKHLQHGFFQQVPHRRVIYNARRLNPTLLSAQQDQPHALTFGFLGTLAPAKGIELLLETFASLSLPDAKLYVGGKGQEEYEHSLKRYASDSIHFLGYTSPEEYFPLIDVLIVPSICLETFPTVIIESLAHGVPVIASRRGGIPELIQDGRNGFLFEPEQPTELASIIQQLAHNPTQYHSMRSTAYDSSQRFLDTEHWLDQYEELFFNVTHGAN